jgi:hypothetical protein
VNTRKTTESTALPGVENTVQASQMCSSVYVRPPRITVLAVEPVSRRRRGTRIAYTNTIAGSTAPAR